LTGASIDAFGANITTVVYFTAADFIAEEGATQEATAAVAVYQVLGEADYVVSLPVFLHSV
jgi:hypothetical protein